MADGQRSPVSAYGSRSRPSGGAELWAWLFMRVSGLLLLVLALGHLFIMHVFNSVHGIDDNFVSARYLKLFWRGYDLAMLWLAGIHWLNGLRVLADDYLRGFKRDFAVRFLYGMAALFLALGTWVIAAFQPVRGM